MSDSEIIIGLSTIVVFGVGAQWIGRRAGIPSILLLLPAGVLAGGVLGWVEPEEMFGDTLFPGITLLVSLLLFQSALGLRIRDLPRNARGPVLRLITIGAFITFVGSSIAVLLIFGVERDLAFLVGAILVVSGPTVVGPLLREVRPRDPARAVLNWESTALDPIGAVLGVVVLNLIVNSQGDTHPFMAIAGRLGLGVVVGLAAAALLIFVMSRFLVSDDMKAAVALLFAVAAFTAAELVFSEAGLVATTTLGFVAATQELVPTARIKGFGETLEVIIIGSLFIVLGALVDLHALRVHGWRTAVLVAVLVVVIRPIAVGVALIATRISIRERAFIGWVDPRGVVAAATAAQFSGTLADASFASEFMLPIVFGVIVGTGVVYGLSAGPVARRLGVREPPRMGVALVGNAPWLHSLGVRLHDLGVSVLLVTSQPSVEDDNAHATLPTVSVHDSEDDARTALGSAATSQALIAAPPGPVLSLFTAGLVEVLGRRNVLDLPADRSRLRPDGEAHYSRAHPFAPNVTSRHIDGLVERGATVQMVSHPTPAGALVLARVGHDSVVNLTPHKGRTRAGERVIALVSPEPA
ncbi:MAG TPA: sodium:proton antiporter [Acidimicrobiia bacterium]|nr:sodium:proton antiporter [Acidimicrobiia bacterium]